ncbi:MAG TPA: hypothetical protein VE130_09580 [Nitrososphaeraceae archaeon]|jgi:hypothetical protein|nr:hypothetical protein [Nitrososphaeraceae archaeon]
MAKDNGTSINVRPDIRAGLKHIARKDQSYNELLADLIKLHLDHYSKMGKNCNCSLISGVQSKDQIAVQSIAEVTH